jgi:hypothetical protein
MIEKARESMVDFLTSDAYINISVYSAPCTFNGIHAALRAKILLPKNKGFSPGEYTKETSAWYRQL